MRNYNVVNLLKYMITSTSIYPTKYVYSREHKTSELANELQPEVKIKL